MAESTTLKDLLLKLVADRDSTNLSLFVEKNKIVDSTYADYDAVVHACRIWNWEALDILLMAGARPHDERNPDKFTDTPMYHALLLNDCRMVESLIHNGYSFRKASVSDTSPAETLFCATKRNPAMVEIVLNQYIKEKYNPPDRHHLAPSHIACMYGTSDVFKKFLDFDKSAVTMHIRKQFDVNLGGASPLHVAVMYGKHEHALMLLERDAYPLALNDSSRTPLHYAAYRKDKHMVKLLFAYLNVKRMRANPCDWSGISLFHIACWLGPAEVVKDFIRGGQYDINGAIDKITFDHRNREFFGYTPLHFAVKSDDVAKIELLLTNGALPSVVSGQENHMKATPLTLAVKLSFQEAINVLTKVLCLHDLHSVAHDIGFATLYHAIFEHMNIHSNLPGLGKWDSCPPLHYAVARRDVELVESLLKAGANVNGTDDRGLTPLMLACILTTKMTELVKGFDFKSGKDSLIAKTRMWFNRKDSPQLRIVKLLLEYKADVNMADIEGRTALVFLTTNSLFKWVDIEVTEEMKNNLFGYAYNIILQLLHHGATLTPRCHGGSTLIHTLCEVENITDLFVTSENARIRLLTLYVKAGCDVNAKTENDNTPLHMALSGDMFDLAEQLIKSGANIHAKTNEGETALHVVAGSFAPMTRDHFVAYLLEMGIDINASTMTEQSTILHLAVRLSLNNNNRLVALLLEHGADVDARDSRNATPLHYAIVANNEIVTTALANFGANMNILNAVDETPLSLAGRMMSDVNSCDAALFAARFINRMRAIGWRFVPENERFVEKIAAMRIGDVGFQAGPINDEIDRLKSRAVVSESKTTMYSLLLRDVHEMRHFARNEQFVEFILSRSFVKEFPLFGPLIVARIRRAIVRERVLNPARLVLSVVMRLEIPAIVDNILKLFSDFELLGLVQTSLADPAVRAEVDSRKQSSMAIPFNLLDDDNDNEYCAHS